MTGLDRRGVAAHHMNMVHAVSGWMATASKEEFTLYNYGMATEPMLGSVREVADLIGSRR